MLVLLLAVMPLFGQSAGIMGGFGGGMSGYDGPSILGRTGPGVGTRGGESIPIHAHASLNGTYNSNLLGYSVDSAGQLQSGSSVGFNAMVGVSGRKQWRRTFMGLDYSGDYNYFTKQTFLNGTNHQMNFGAGWLLGRKWQISSQVGAGTTNRFLGGQAVFQANQIEFLSVPNAELFDSRTYFIGNTTSATYSINRRNSVRFAGNASTVRRRAPGLADMNSYGGSSDWVYRLNRRTSMGVSYQFGHFDFSKIFGESDLHTIGVHTSRQFGRAWSLNLMLTGTKQSTVGVRSVALDPVLVAILGRATGSEVFESNNLVYGYSAGISRRIRRSTIAASMARATNPGNGFFVTSLNESRSGRISHEVSRNFAVSGTFGYDKVTSLGFASGAFKSWVASANVTRKLTESFGFNAQYDWRTFDLQRTTFGRTGSQISVGLTYFPRQSIAGLF